MQRNLFILALVLGVASAASAVDSTWDSGGGADQSWTNAANWNADTLPSMSVVGVAKVYKTTGIAQALVNTATAQAFQVKIGGPNPPTTPATWSTLTVANGGTLNVGEYVMVGIDSTVVRSGELDMTGGTINLGQVNPANGHLFLGHTIAGTTGILNMSNGTINVTGNFVISYNAGTIGIANLSGGTINTANFEMNHSGTGTASLDISGAGKLVINHNVTGTINTYKTNGWITANGDGYGDLRAVYDSISDKTTVYAVPEPASLCLLGIGALSLIRRKK